MEIYKLTKRYSKNRAQERIIKIIKLLLMAIVIGFSLGNFYLPFSPLLYKFFIGVLFITIINNIRVHVIRQRIDKINEKDYSLTVSDAFIEVQSNIFQETKNGYGRIDITNKLTTIPVHEISEIIVNKIEGILFFKHIEKIEIIIKNRDETTEIKIHDEIEGFSKLIDFIGKLSPITYVEKNRSNLILFPIVDILINCLLYTFVLKYQLVATLYVILMLISNAIDIVSIHFLNKIHI